MASWMVIGTAILIWLELDELACQVRNRPSQGYEVRHGIRCSQDLGHGVRI